MMKLVLLIADMAVNEFPFEKDALSIGRSADNDIVLDDPLVSSRHAQVTISHESGGDSIASIEDLGSTNGTRVNGKDVRKHRLKHDDLIQIGRNSLRIITAP